MRARCYTWPMRSLSAKHWLLVLMSALLQIFSFPTDGPVPVWRAAFSWICLVPFLVALVMKDRDGALQGARAGALLGYGCGVLWYFGNCWWIYQTMYLYGGMAKPVALGILILFSLYLGLYHALFGWIVVLLHRSRLGLTGALFFVPFAWVAVELARARITYFPWDLLGYARVDNLALDAIAPLAGVMGISFVLAVANSIVAAAILSRGRTRIGLGLLAMLLAGCFELYGLFGGHGTEPSWEGQRPTATLMQENLSVGTQANLGSRLTIEEELRIFSGASAAPDRPDHGKTCADCAPAIVVWPEAPSHFQSDDPRFREAMKLLAIKANAPVIAGSLGVDRDPAAPRGYRLYDSAAMFDASGTYQGRYDKIHLVPWGEYIPFKSFFSFAEKLTEGAGDMDRGSRRTVFRTGGHAYGVFVCYESIFGDEVRQFVKNGADVLVNISDDGWYGDTGAPWQHLNMARMRAIENRRWIIRSTNTGVTTTIDPLGRYRETERHRQVAYQMPFEYASGQTFYTRHGDWFAWLCAAVTVCAVGFSWPRGRLTQNPRSVRYGHLRSATFAAKSKDSAGNDRLGKAIN